MIVRPRHPGTHPAPRAVCLVGALRPRRYLSGLSGVDGAAKGPGTVVERARLWCEATTIARPVLVLLVLGSSACAVVTPLCDEGESLVGAGRLSRGAEAYALARQRGEGDCAETGLSTVGDRYGDVYVNIARGRAAEDGQDVEAATAAYRAALTFDVDNPAATEALARLQQPVPQLREPEPVAPTPVGEPLSPLIVVLVVVAVALLGVMVGLLAWIAWRWRGQSVARQREDEEARERLAEVRGEMHAVEDRLLTALTKLDETVKEGALVVDGRLAHHRKAVGDVLEAVASVRQELERVRDDVNVSADRRAAELEQHLDDVVDVITDVVGEGGEQTHDRFVHPGS